MISMNKFEKFKAMAYIPKIKYDGQSKPPSENQVLWYQKPAYDEKATIYDRDQQDWQKQATPIGSGRMGAMVFGHPAKDYIQFNEETMWSGEYLGMHDDRSNVWKLCREDGLNDCANTNNMNRLVNTRMGETVNRYLNGGNIFVDFNMSENSVVKNYYRDLNLNNAVASVSYESDDVVYKREYFASYVDDVIAISYTTDGKNQLNFTVNAISAHPAQVCVKDGLIKFEGIVTDGILDYATLIKVVNVGGSVIDNEDSVEVKNADSVVIYITAKTNYDKDSFKFDKDGNADISKKPFKNENIIPSDLVQKIIDNATNKGYKKIYKDHVLDYKNLFDRVKFSLTDKICDIPTDKLQESYKNAYGYVNDNKPEPVKVEPKNPDKLDRYLEQLYYHYGRYLMIASSRPGCLPSTLQGKWVSTNWAIWGSSYTININLQMNYWMAGTTNLSECAIPLIDWVEAQSKPGKITAKNTYGIKNTSGNNTDDVWFMHAKASPFGTTDLTGSATYGITAGNSAWIMHNLWDYYLKTLDIDMLREKIYPLMRSLANFYAEYLHKDEKTGEYISGPGMSPENGQFAMGIKYDQQLIYEFYTECIKAAELLNLDDDKVVLWKNIADNIQEPIEIGVDGQIKEWAKEQEYNKDANGVNIGDPLHRHISQLVGLWPGSIVQSEKDRKAAEQTLIFRGDASTGWSCAFKFGMWARLLDGDRALNIYGFQLAEKTHSNLFDTHPPFQIDGNFGSVSALVELLVQSYTGKICILPALPKKWDKGMISGIILNDGIEISITWENCKAKTITLKPKINGDIQLSYEFLQNAVVCDDNGNTMTLTQNENDTYTLPNCQAGICYEIKIV